MSRLARCLLAALTLPAFAPQTPSTSLHVGRLDGQGLAGPGTASTEREQVSAAGQSDDVDGDGLTNKIERRGWDIVIDENGYGVEALGSLLTVRHVTSNPGVVDTDGDGLEDGEEWLIGSDPRSVDTDGDGLTDAEEWNTWFTSPNSVDTDGDSRGPSGGLAPNVSLFDGFELNVAPRTSPTLDDTDGDGRTDFEEYDHPSFSPLLAELPQAAVTIAGDLDVRLDVEYAETEEVSTAYEVTFSESQTETQGIEQSSSWGLSSSWSWNLGEAATVTGGVETTPPNSSAEVSYQVSVGYSESGETTHETAFVTSQESAQTSEQTHSKYVSDTQAYTEVTASGSISVPVRIRNDGDFTFTLQNLGITLTRFTPPTSVGGQPGFTALGTVLPAFDQITLAPGEESPVLALDSGDMNTDVIREFLANPSSLVLQPSQFNMVDQQGIDFDFLTETTFNQTAMVEIDHGAGDVEQYRVATNVDREGFDYLGISMPTVMNDILGIDFGTQKLKDSDGNLIQGVDADGEPADVRVLTRIGDQEYEVDGDGDVIGFWAVLVEGPLDDATQTEDGSSIDFRTIRLYGGSTIRLLYTRDQDQDGLWEAQELMLGTSDLSANSDGDNLSDYEEAVEGWEYPAGSGLRVYSDPRHTDTDQDGRGDAYERNNGLDPTDPDCDDDGLLDGEDPFPLIPSVRLFAVADDHASPGGDGSSWDANTSLADVFERAKELNTDQEAENDVGAIWVERGLYSGDDVQLKLPEGVKIYGGFQFGDGKLGQRDPDPLTNETVIYSPSSDPGGQGDSQPLLTINLSSDNAPAVTLDGFTLTGCSDAALAVVRVFQGHAILRNLLIAQNSTGNGALLINNGGYADVEQCLFLQNSCFDNGAAVSDRGERQSTFTDCEFALNSSETRGGAVERLHKGPGAPVFTRCSFFSNEVSWGQLSEPEHGGGAVYTEDGGCFLDCDFFGNRTRSTFAVDHTQGELHAMRGGGLYFGRVAQGDDAQTDYASVDLVNCRFFGNISGTGGGVYAEDSGLAAVARGLNVVNCSFAQNIGLRVIGLGDPTEDPSGGLHVADTLTGFLGDIVIHNSIFWDNAHDGQFDPNELLPYDVEQANLSLEGAYTGLSSVTFTTIKGMLQGSGDFLGGGNSPLDPLFGSSFGGNLRLSDGSPAIDTGYNAADVDIATPGFQPLPATDLDGNPRLTDGDGIGDAVVDRGAYEAQS